MTLNAVNGVMTADARCLCGSWASWIHCRLDHCNAAFQQGQLTFW